MGFLFKPTYSKIDPKTGRRVKRRATKWYGSFVDHLDISRRVPLSADKQAARQMLSDLERKAELARAGVFDVYEEHRQKPLAAHLDDFVEVLKARGNTEGHVETVRRHCDRILTGIKAVFIGDITASAVETFLAQCRKEGMSAQTSNHHIRGIKQFTRWLVNDRRTGDNALAPLSMLNAKLDRRRQRRALTSDETARLIAAAERGPVVAGITGPDRSKLYLVASLTGLRASELQSLSPESFDFETMTATLAARSSKRRRQDTLPLHPGAASTLRKWIETKAPGVPLWGPDWASKKRGASMLRADLEAAGIPYVDDDGKVADFHALRATFITSLARAGVSPKVCQELARHSDVNLTLGVYSIIGLHDTAAAVAMLPDPTAPRASLDSQANRATGTDNRLALRLAPDSGDSVPFGASSCRDKGAAGDKGMSPATLSISRENAGNPAIDEAAQNGRGEIRTHERLSALPVFKTGAIGHSATRPIREGARLARRFSRPSVRIGE